jgi:hypothetical protein
LVQEKYLRSAFECSALDAQKQACIEAAEILQFDDLVDELKHSLYTDRLISSL